MVQVDSQLSTGLPGLDTMLRGLMPGDNIVWQVESIEDYIPFVGPYCAKAVLSGRKPIYFRFARHDPLITDPSLAETCVLDPADGFETFLGNIHAKINAAGRGAYYVFDCLSDLSVDWYSDRMLGNFFMLTCPYLFDLETITYFALFRNHHSAHATGPISETTQLFLDVYKRKNKLYVHPLKVQQRFSPTMHMLHVWERDNFVPVRESYINAEILTSGPRFALDSARQRLGTWTQTVLQAEEAVDHMQRTGRTTEEADGLFHRLLRMAISRDDRVLGLVEKYFDLQDLLSITKRMVGTGLIGGKSVGMLLARAILKRQSPRLAGLLELHDSFYIASDVFYTFLVLNGCWWLRHELRDPERLLRDAEQVRRRILTGKFPDHIERQFGNMLDYFGQSPIIVRSSSLLEDNFGNAFAGKYESVFCVNQGSRERRLQDFISAVRTIYASTMSERALTYRSRRGMLDKDEQMALLVQRVSGSVNGSYFFPQAAGVGYSFNPYVWSEDIDPHAGFLRLVFGLGTRAVDRSDDDYTRLVALNAPERRPEGEAENMRQYMQQKVDVLDIESNQLASLDFMDVAEESPDLPLDLFASRDTQLERYVRQSGRQGGSYWMLTFDKLLSQTPFVQDMREILETIHTAYDYPVDIEFTANFTDENDYRINIVQCRPFQVKGSTVLMAAPDNIAEEDLVLRTVGPVIGQSRIDNIARVIYVVPSVYAHLPLQERYSIARLIGQIMRVPEAPKPENILLLGPGRWGTSTPSLGVPVTFAEISGVSTLCEIVAMRDDLVPDVSLGTHFFSELVEMDMLYLALFPNKKGNHLNTAFFENMPNKAGEILPTASAYAHVIRVLDTANMGGGQILRLHADTLKQTVTCYIDRTLLGQTSA